MAKLSISSLKRLLQAFKNGSTTVDACRHAGISRVSLFHWCEKYPKLKTRIDSIKYARTPLVEDVVYMKALQGDLMACKMYLTNKGGWRNTDVNLAVNNTTNKIQVESTQNIQNVYLSKEEQDKRLKENARIIKSYGLLDIADSQE